MVKEALTFVIFGGTGDLAKRKLAPAFSKLIHEGILKKNSTLIGVSRGNLSDEKYRNLLIKSVEDNKEKKHLREINVKHLKMDFSKPENIKKLNDLLPECEVTGCNRIYYLATRYKLFPSILQGLRKQNLLSKNDKYNKIVFEKPFGLDMKSGELLDKQIHKFVSEKQIYRIDHYLGKETVANIIKFKSKNKELWKFMNNKNVEKIEVISDEKLGVGNRMGYYNNAGSIRDMIQSHLLQVLSLILMEIPKKITTKRVHDRKLKLLKKINFLESKDNLIGQYKSYGKEVKEIGIRTSKTESFSKIFLECKNRRWKGVEIILRTGKKLPRKYSQAVIYFKNKDKITLNFYPNQNIKAKFKSKLKNIKIRSKKLFHPNTSEEYKLLIEEVIQGDSHLFVRSDVVRESWRIVDKVDRKKIKFVIYPDCSDPEKL